MRVGRSLAFLVANLIITFLELKAEEYQLKYNKRNNHCVHIETNKDNLKTCSGKYHFFKWQVLLSFEEMIMVRN